MELMELTDKYGQRCLVNPAQVVTVKHGFCQTMLIMAHRTKADCPYEEGLLVKESLAEVAVKWARAMRVEEME